MQTVVNINGQIFSPSTLEELHAQAQVSVFDRSYLYGDSLYEVCRTYGGKMFLTAEHLRRMEKSAELCRMTLSQTSDHYAREMQRTLDAFHQKTGSKKSEAYVRIIVSRGVGKIGFALNCLQTPTQYTVIAQPLEDPTPAQVRKGLNLKIVDRLRNSPRALDPAMKSGNYLNSLLAFLDAAGEDYDDALMCNADGHLTEGTTFNIGYIRRGIIATPPLDIGILDGLSRRVLFEIAGRMGIEVREVRFPRERLYEADEVFMCSTTKEVFPVTRVDGRKIGKGEPGPLTLKLRDAFRKEALARLSAGGKK